jgi:flagellar biosynthesis/type III secretory pathway chaperone
MRDEVTRLVTVLEEQTTLARELVAVLQADQRRIIEQDVAGLEASNRDKETVVVRFQALERTRRETAARLSVVLGLEPDEARVSALCQRLGPEGAELEAQAERLRAVLASLQELVAIGTGFLEQSILGIRGLLALIQSLRTPGPQTYDALGRLDVANPQAVALRREA